MNAATKPATKTARPTFAVGDLVFVRPGYDMDTKANTRMDTWADTYMHVVKVCSNGDYLLDYDLNGEGEVYVNEARLSLD